MISLCVCYHLRFVETVRILALQGAELVCMPTAWLPGFDQQRWDPEGYCPQAHDRGALINPFEDRRSDVYGLSVAGTVL